MSDTSKIYLTNGITYVVQGSPESLFKVMTHSDGKSKNHVHELTLLNNKKVYLNSNHVVAVEEADSDSDKAEQMSDDDRVKNNEEAAKKFKEDLDGNME